MLWLLFLGQGLGTISTSSSMVMSQYFGQDPAALGPHAIVGSNDIPFTDGAGKAPTIQSLSRMQ